MSGACKTRLNHSDIKSSNAQKLIVIIGGFVGCVAQKKIRAYFPNFVLECYAIFELLTDEDRSFYLRFSHRLVFRRFDWM